MTQAPIPIESHAEAMRAPFAMRGAIVRALAKAPEERFQTVKEFIDAFDASSTAPNAATPADGSGAHQKTEIGAPLDIAAAFGRPGGAAAAGRLGGPVTRQGQGPTEANMALPTPATIPQPPPRDDGRRTGRTALLAAAGIIAAASVGAIVFAMRGGSGQGKSVVFDPAAPTAPATQLEPAIAPADSATAPASAAGGSNSEVPPLSAGGRGAPRPAPAHPVAGAASAAGGASSPSGHSAPSVPSPAPAAAKYDGPECQTARRLKALGHPKEAESWAIACSAKGGTP